MLIFAVVYLTFCSSFWKLVNIIRGFQIVVTIIQHDCAYSCVWSVILCLFVNVTILSLSHSRFSKDGKSLNTGWMLNETTNTHNCHFIGLPWLASGRSYKGRYEYLWTIICAYIVHYNCSQLYTLLQTVLTGKLGPCCFRFCVFLTTRISFLYFCILFGCQYQCSQLPEKIISKVTYYVSLALNSTRSITRIVLRLINSGCPWSASLVLCDVFALTITEPFLDASTVAAAAVILSCQRVSQKCQHFLSYSAVETRQFLQSNPFTNC